MAFRIHTTLVAAAIALAAPLAMSAGYPDKTINYIIPFGPGGESDVSARLQAPVFKKFTGQGLAIQYKAGAGGADGWSQLSSMAGEAWAASNAWRKNASAESPTVLVRSGSRRTSAASVLAMERGTAVIIKRAILDRAGPGCRTTPHTSSNARSATSQNIGAQDGCGGYTSHTP